MKSVNKTVCSILCVAMLLVTATVFAGGSHECKSKKWSLKDKFFHKVEFIMENADEIDLSDEQIKSIKKLKMDVKKMIVIKEAEAEVTWLDVMSELYYEDKADLDLVNSLIDQKYEVKKSLAKGLAAAYLELKGTLSKDQMEELKKIWMEKK